MNQASCWSMYLLRVRDRAGLFLGEGLVKVLFSRESFCGFFMLFGTLLLW